MEAKVELMEEKINILKLEAELIRGSGVMVPGFRWPKEFKGKCLLILEGGILPHELSPQLGIAEKTLKNWHARNSTLKLKSKSKINFKEIQITKEIKIESTIFVSGPGGHKIGGLSIDQLHALLREGLI